MPVEEPDHDEAESEQLEIAEASSSDSVEEDEPVRLASQDEASVVVHELPAEPAPKRLEVRVTEPYAPIKDPQTTIVPQESEYCYSNSLAALERHDVNCEMNFRFKDGKGTQKGFYGKRGQRWVEFDQERAVKTIEIYYKENENVCFGLRLKDKNKELIAESWPGYFASPGCKINKIELKEGEKILGIKCRQDDVFSTSLVYDLQFVLGKLA